MQSTSVSVAGSRHLKCCARHSLVRCTRRLVRLDPSPSRPPPGNVPLEWYDEFDHVGYDLEGRKIMRGARKDELDALIDRFDNPDAGRTIHDYGERASGVTGACPG